MPIARFVLVAAGLVHLTGCCCCGSCGSSTPPTDAEVRILAAGDPLVIKVDGQQKASLSAYSGTVLRVLPGRHDVQIEAGGRPAITTSVDVKAGDDVFVGGHDTTCFAIVENPADFGHEPRWDPAKDPVPTTWSLVHVLQPGQSWPEGGDLYHVTDSPSTLSVSMSDRLVAPYPCASTSTDADVTAGMTEVLARVDKF